MKYPNRIKYDKKLTQVREVLNKENKLVPQLKISGNYLSEHGFKADDLVEVLVKEELLIIQPMRNV